MKTTSAARQQQDIGDKGLFLNRMKKIEWQVGVIQRMIEENGYHVDIVLQLAVLSEMANEVAFAFIRKRK